MHLNTTVCCNHIFTAKDVAPPLLNKQQALGTSDVNLYGGNVKKFCRAKCPECGKEYLLWLRPQHNTYRVVTMSALQQSELEESGEPESELTALNINQLRKMASEAGIKNYAALKKTELIEQLQAV